MATVPRSWSCVAVFIAACVGVVGMVGSAQAAPVNTGVIAYVRAGQQASGIYVVASGASSARRLTSSVPSDENAALAWSADGRWLAFAQNGLAVVDSTNGSVRKLTNQADTSPSWDSAANLWFRRGGELYRTRMNGSPQRVETKCGDGPGEISADGKSFVYTTGDEVHVCGTDNVVPDRVVVTAEEGQQIRGPRWSPNGQRIVYFVPPRDGEWGLYVTDVTGPQSTHLGEGTSPDWSPDGKVLVFAQSESLMLANTDGSQRRHVTTQSGNVSGSSPAWGKKFVQPANPKPPADDGSGGAGADRPDTPNTADGDDTDAEAAVDDAEPDESSGGSGTTGAKNAGKGKRAPDNKKDAQAAPGEFTPPVTTDGPDRRWLIAGLIGGLAMIGTGSGIAFWLLRQRGVG